MKVRLVDSESHTIPALLVHAMFSNQFKKFIAEADREEMIKHQEETASKLYQLFADVLCEFLKETIERKDEVSENVKSSIDILKEREDTLSVALGESEDDTVEGFLLTVDYFLVGKSLTPVIRLASFSFGDDGRPQEHKLLMEGNLDSIISSPLFKHCSVSVSYAFAAKDSDIAATSSEEWRS